MKHLSRRLDKQSLVLDSRVPQGQVVINHNECGCNPNTSNIFLVIVDGINRAAHICLLYDKVY